jgi:hypothetical protein
MKEPARVVKKGVSFLTEVFILKVKSLKVLSKRSLIHSDGFQPKI